MGGFKDALSQKFLAGVSGSQKWGKDFVVNESVVYVEALRRVNVVELLFVGGRFVLKNGQRSEVQILFARLDGFFFTGRLFHWFWI